MGKPRPFESKALYTWCEFYLELVSPTKNVVQIRRLTLLRNPGNDCVSNFKTNIQPQKRSYGERLIAIIHVASACICLFGHAMSIRTLLREFLFETFKWESPLLNLPFIGGIIDSCRDRIPYLMELLINHGGWPAIGKILDYKVMKDHVLHSHSEKYARAESSFSNFCRAPAPQDEWEIVMSKRQAAKVRKANLHNMKTGDIDNDENFCSYLNDMPPNESFLISQGTVENDKKIQGLPKSVPVRTHNPYAKLSDVPTEQSKDDKAMNLGLRKPVPVGTNNPNAARQRRTCATGMNFILNGNYSDDDGYPGDTKKINFNMKKK